MGEKGTSLCCKKNRNSCMARVPVLLLVRVTAMCLSIFEKIVYHVVKKVWLPYSPTLK